MMCTGLPGMRRMKCPRNLSTELRSVRQLYHSIIRGLVTRHEERVVEHRVCQPH